MTYRGGTPESDTAAIASTAFHDMERGPQTEELDELAMPGQPTLGEVALDALSDSDSDAGE